MKNHIRSILGVSSFAILVASMPQIAAAQDTDKTSAKEEVVIVTGSSIKRKVYDNALPIQIVTKADLEREGIVNTEQLIMQLSSNGNGLDNLAANADVVSGAARGNNGMSGANLRGQGTQGTLVLLNGRRVAAHGLNGGAVDINQIPMAAIERVDVLKDGASAIYGTDAIGGVINFITKKNYQGLDLSVFADKTEDGGGDIYRASISAGYGNLAENKFNIMGTLAYSENKILLASQRDFVDTFQIDKGLSVDTRGTPYATIFPRAGTIFTSNSTAPLIPGSTTVRASGGINPLTLNGMGCDSVAGMDAYASKLWGDAAGTTKYACSWDTGRAVVLQQPVKNLNFISRAVFKLGEHELSVEATASKVDATKQFSNMQLSSNTTTANFVYPRNSITQATYDEIFDLLKTNFGVAESLRGQPYAVRWRCDICGLRTIDTETKTGRLLVGLDGPMGETEWNYRTGVSYAYSESKSTLGKGFFYSYDTYDTSGTKIANGLFNVLNSGVVNFFLKPGQTQTQAAIDAVNSTSAEGVVLYGGKYEVTQFDGSVSGPMFDLPGGKAYAALGFELREESYHFNGDQRAAAARPVIYNAPFDDANALQGVSRSINAIYAEVALPLIKNMELTLAGRMDQYSGFGVTTNPKISLKYKPIDMVMFRASYNTGFRVPTFNQLFNGVTESPYTATTFADPTKCSTGYKSNTTIAGCEPITFNYLTGGKQSLGPEEAKQYSFGVVLEPFKNHTISFDWWHIDRTGTIQILTLDQLFSNYNLFVDNFERDANGNIARVDQRYVNAGEQLTEGLEVSFRGGVPFYKGKLSYGMDGTYLLEKKSRVLEGVPFGPSEVGVWTAYGDLGIEWKHNLYVTYTQGDWSGSLSQLFRSGYVDQVYPGVASGIFTAADGHTKTDDYITYNASVTYKGFKNFTITGGVKNLLNTDPPFAYAYYSNSGANSDWEPRVADPRGRSFTLLLNYKF